MSFPSTKLERCLTKGFTKQHAYRQNRCAVYPNGSWSPYSILSNKTGALFTQMSRDHHIKFLLTKPAGSLPKWFITQTDKTRALFAKKKEKEKENLLTSLEQFHPKNPSYSKPTDKTGAVFIQSIHHKVCLLTKLELCIPKGFTIYHAY